MEQFKLHLEELSKPEYNVMPLNLIIDSIINDVDLPNKTIGISVDDADRSFLEHGWPLLKEYNFPVTLFVTTNTISDTNKNYLNWEEIRALKDPGVTIAAHSHTHSHLSKFSIKQIKEELETSNKIFLREIKEIPNNRKPLDIAPNKKYFKPDSADLISFFLNAHKI